MGEARLGEFLIAVVIMELTPGPNMGYLASIALTRGRQAGLSASLGAALAFALALVVALAAHRLLAPHLHAAGHVLGALGAAFFLWIGIDAWRDAGRPPTPLADVAAGNWRHAARGWAANLLSPKTWLFYLSVVPAFAGGDLAMQATLGGLHIAVSTIVHVGIVFAAAAFAPAYAASTHTLRLTERVFAACLIALGLWFGWRAIAM
ncbi:MAG: LysE family translocator [Alphaproteobacteria bacterium]|nr:LysE family translocator [Alphaproteobacteria bacterium]